MADIVGLVFSIGEAINALYGYGKNVRDAQQDILCINSELLALSAVLKDIESKDESLVKSPHFLDTLAKGNVTIEELLEKLKRPSGKAAKLRQKLSWPFSKTDVQDLQQRLQSVKETLMLCMMTDASEVTYDIRNQIRDFRDEYRSDQQDAKLEELRQWLEGDVDQKQKHARILNARHPQTGKWFLESQEFQDWLTSKDPETPRVLCVIAMSGAGKTSLMSRAVHAAQTKHIECTGEHDRALAYVYVSFNETISAEPMNPLCVMLSHLSYAYPEIIDGLSPNKGQMDGLSLDEIESRMMTAAAASDSTVHLFVDAVNECRYPESLLESLLRVTESSPNIRLLITSTLEDKRLVKRAAARPPTATFLRMHAIDQDIRMYIDAKLEEHKNLRGLDPKLKQEIRDILGKYSQGMFRYTQLQIDHLGAQPNGKLVRRALNVLHQDINESYALILERIPDSDKAIAKEALTWLCFEYKPMSLEVIIEALAFEAGEDSIDEYGRLTDPDSLLFWFQGMVSHTFSSRGSAITLSHSSVRAFLVSKEIKKTNAAYFSLNQTDADALIMRKCLTYIMFKHFSSGYSDKMNTESYRIQQKWPLLRYAATQWAIHAFQLGDRIQPEDERLVLAFLNTWFTPNHGNFGFWVQCINGHHANLEVAERTQPLYYAASYGLRRVVQLWLAAHKDVSLDAPGGRFMSNAIHIACFRGHYALAKDLRDAGARLPRGTKGGRIPCIDHDERRQPKYVLDDQKSQDPTREYQLCCTKVVERYQACKQCVYFEHRTMHSPTRTPHLVEEMTIYVGGACPNHPKAATGKWIPHRTVQRPAPNMAETHG